MSSIKRNPINSFLVSDITMML